MPDPVFSGSDRVDQNGLPAELQGKSAAEVAAYYQRQLADTREAARRAIASAGAGSPQTPPTVRQPNEPVRPVTTTPHPTLTKEQFWQDPVAAAQQLQAGLITQEQFQTLTAPFIESMVDVARDMARRGKPHWDKYAVEIESVMANMTQQQRATTRCWEITYNTVIGSHAADIEKDAVARATAPPSTLPPSGAPETPAAPVDLTSITASSKRGTKNAAQVAEGLGLSHDQYRKGMERVAGDQWPLTVDNRRG